MERLLNDMKFGFKSPKQVMKEINKIHFERYKVYFLAGFVTALGIVLIVNFLIN